MCNFSFDCIVWLSVGGEWPKIKSKVPYYKRIKLKVLCSISKSTSINQKINFAIHDVKMDCWWHNFHIKCRKFIKINNCNIFQYRAFISKNVHYSNYYVSFNFDTICNGKRHVHCMPRSEYEHNCADRQQKTITALVSDKVKIHVMKTIKKSAFTPIDLELQ